VGFIQDFIKFNEGNECPKDYVLWAAYGALSAAIGRRIYIDLKQFYVIPNVYILLVGPSGGRKTFARDKAVDLLLEAVPDTVFAGENETYQGVISFLSHEDQERQFMDNGKVVSYRPYCIFAAELMDYLQLNPIGMVTFLTNVYDRRHYIYRLKHEESVLENPYVMMCACTTPVWLTEQVKSKQFSEGYGRRTIIVCCDSIIRKEPSMSADSLAAYQSCIRHLQRIQKLVGEVKIEETGRRWFWDEWYTKQRDPDDPFLRNWYSSKHINLLKCAMLSVISEGDDLYITKNHLQMNLALLEHVEKGLPMITQLMGRSEVTGASAQLLQVIKNHKGRILEKELKILTIKEFRDMTEQWKVLEFLRTTNQIYQIPEKDEKGIQRIWIVTPDRIKT
jgi:hypothetical protein